jgi:hypothetical protein
MNTPVSVAFDYGPKGSNHPYYQGQEPPTIVTGTRLVMDDGSAPTQLTPTKDNL